VFRREWLQIAGKLAAGSMASLFVLDANLSGASQKMRRTALSSRAMGTRINVTGFGDREDVRSVLEGAIREIDTIDRLMTIHRDDSDLTVANRSGGRSGKPDPMTLEVARESLAIASLTGGALDPTILPLMQIWGFTGPTKWALESHIEAVVDRVGYRSVQVTDDRILLEGDRQIDFGSIAKGYGVDQAVGRAITDGIQNVMVEAGGDLYAAGRPEPDRRWTIGVRDPERPSRLFATIDVENEAVATSGGYEKFRVFDGRKVPHILDPRTGHPAQGTISATIVAPTTMQADALSTATFVLGIDAAMDLISSIPEVEGLWVDADGRRWMTQGLKRRVQFV
jgi:FAD:protein FMN transferase